MKLLNTHIASEKNIHGARVAQTVLGKEGHVIWGPYETRAPGRYKVIFCISGIDLTGCADGDCVAIADVACNNGQDILGVRYIAAGELRAGQTHFEILFSALTNKYSVEYRVSVQGNARLEIDTYRPVTDEATLSSDIIFPKLDENSPTFFRDNIDILRRWYESDFRVMIKGDDVIMTKDGISFYAKVRDDINLIGEIFLEKVYRFERRRPTVVMDVGMNIGLVSMQFAKNPTVQKIYSFEPFPSTYDRAIANLSLNPELAKKIIPSNIGLSDVEGTITFNVFDSDDSGSRSTRDTDIDGAGIPTELQMETAATALRRIRSLHPDDDIIMKIDCEGAEYNIFQNLHDSGLLPEVTMFMVEWHEIHRDKNQRHLIAPLVEAGFTVFDRSPPSGNGFFYAIK